jgi:hypothetical protein
MNQRPDGGSARSAARPTLEVEPLTDARWGRIEQSLMERLEAMPSSQAAEGPSRLPAPSRGNARLRSAALVGGCSLAAAAAAIALHAAWPSSGMDRATSRVVTEASPSHVTFAETSIDVSPESGIVVREEEHATVLTLERGEVALHVAPRPKDRPFLVEAGDVHVRVVGTEFSVRRVGIGATVAVRRGVVEVREHDELARVAAGEKWPGDVAGAPSQPVGSPLSAAPSPGQAPAQALPLALAPSQATSPIASPATSPLAPTVIPAAPPPRTTRATARTRVASAAHATATAPTTTREPSADPLALPAAVDAAPTPPAPAPVMEPSAQEKYEAAEQVERADPARALRMYTALAQGSDAWAQNALYAAGRLQADRGARSDAARLLEEYLRRFPRGSNAQDARSLRESLR